MTRIVRFADGLAESHGTPRAPIKRSLWDLLQEAVDKSGQNLALACLQHKPDYLFPNPSPSPNLEWTYSQLSSYAQLLASKIHDAGAHLEGAVMTPFVSSAADWSLFFWAAAKLNMPIAALDPKILQSTDTTVQEHYFRTLQPHIVCVQDEAAADLFDGVKSPADYPPALKLMVTSKNGAGKGDWIDFQQFLNSKAKNGPTNGRPHRNLWCRVDASQSVARILFTGGSTGLPKACPHTGANLTAESEDYFTMRGLTQKARTLIQSPCHHIMANAGALLTWRGGGAVVQAASAFDAGESIRAIQTYKVTYLPVHHSMSDALLRHPTFSTEAVSSVQYMQVGGALIGPELADLYFRQFGGLEMFPFWGSTEGMYTTACSKGDALVSADGLLSVGRAYTGGRVKIADPDTNATLSYGQVGELHYGGNTVISGYAGGKSAESFYTDANGYRWFKTGDQGRMAPDGQVFMLGRFKDMIKRGGENIFPQQIEHRLLSICKTKVMIIGIPDEVTGESCVAVVDPAQSEDFSAYKLQADVSKHFGADFVFSHILTLSDLGLEKYPLGPGGKVKKPILRENVLEHLKTVENGVLQNVQFSIISLVKSTWARLLHIDPAVLDDDFSIHHLMDSLTAMRYCFEIEKAIGKRLSPAHLQRAPTIRDQAGLLEEATKSNAVETVIREGPPSVEDVVMCEGDSKILEDIKDHSQPVLKLHGFTWDDDVLDIYVAPDYLGPDMPSRRSQNLRFAFEVVGFEYSAIRKAVANALATQSTLQTVGVRWRDVLLMVQLRQSDKLLDRIIEKGPDFATVDEAVHHAIRHPEYLMTCPPQDMLARFGIAAVPGKQAHVITMSLNHACGDGMSNGPLWTELEAQLNAIRSNTIHTPTTLLSFKTYADMHYSLGNSLAADVSARYVAKQIRGISKHAGAAWPPHNGNDFYAEDQMKDYYGSTQLHQSAKTPGILSLQQQHGVPPGIALKTAFSMAMMATSHKSSAQFLSIYAARSWPFQPDWVQEHLPNPASIGGPTIRPRWEWIRPEANESVLDLMQRMQRDETETQPHLQTPLASVLSHLPDEDVAYLGREMKMILFNHVPDIGRFTRHERAQLKWLKQRAFTYYCAQPAYFQCGFLQGDERETCVVAGVIDETQFNRSEFEVFTQRVLAVLRMIVAEGNWNKPVNSFSITNGYH